ncbi:putative transcriptional regulator [Vibrio orientalis CIP 102891 = ATCC 33934]|uniref:Putative transcriptional regulator n=1 Tax=Vibrio orientalis CIP 102891 = ATCC 33934 TaxID=675816 RepID=C9QEV4_VIBOR|nr:LysR family transcriptional regulator [Vibrio orientalis]EEX94664.1 putative transcription regulator protein [Vibrio orientalis CIP 102891 = ATCC 33934]EGU51361.1 putative transcriptional regulator [Vibrio orientalis CIP 102891 = ATCC 33934]
MKKVENLQLLYTLLEVYYTQNLSEAGRKLGKTTSSVSKELSKLREQFDDTLFVRSNNRMLPTEYVKSIAPEIEQMLRDIGHTLMSKNTISNKNYCKPIKVGISHILMELYGAEISLQLSKQFPQASIELLTWDSVTNQQLQNEQIDFGIHFNLVFHPGKIRYRRITASNLVVICPEGDTDKSLEQLSQERDFMFCRLKDWNDTETNFFDIASDNGISINRSSLIVDNFNIAMKLVNRENLCFIVPQDFADYYQAPYISWPLPTKGIVIGLYHHAQQNEMLTAAVYDSISKIIKTPSR